MKTIILFAFKFFLLILIAQKACCQSNECKPLKINQGWLNLNGHNNTLIDNALRHFELSSIGSVGDSLVRIWILEDSYPDTPVTALLRMFELGKNLAVPTAKLYTMSWTYTNDSTLPVKCVTENIYHPKNGWDALGKELTRMNLPKLFAMDNNPIPVTVADFGMIMLQFIYGQTTKTFDFTASVDLNQEMRKGQSIQSKKFVSLLLLIEKHLGIRLSLDSKNRDFLIPQYEEIPKIPEVPIDGVGFDNGYSDYLLIVSGSPSSTQKSWSE